MRYYLKCSYFKIENENLLYEIRFKSLSSRDWCVVKANEIIPNKDNTGLVRILPFYTNQEQAVLVGISNLDAIDCGDGEEFVAMWRFLVPDKEIVRKRSIEDLHLYNPDSREYFHFYN